MSCIHEKLRHGLTVRQIVDHVADFLYAPQYPSAEIWLRIATDNQRKQVIQIFTQSELASKMEINCLSFCNRLSHHAPNYKVYVPMNVLKENRGVITSVLEKLIEINALDDFLENYGY